MARIPTAIVVSPTVNLAGQRLCFEVKNGFARRAESPHALFVNTATIPDRVVYLAHVQQFAA
jgi:hypothetical protein